MLNLIVHALYGKYSLRTLFAVVMIASYLLCKSYEIIVYLHSFKINIFCFYNQASNRLC